MKNKVYLNRINFDYQTPYAQAKEYFKRHGVEMTYEFWSSNYSPLSSAKVQFPQGQRFIVQPSMAQKLSIDTTYDFTSFVFNGSEFPPTTCPQGYTYLPSTQPFMDIDFFNGALDSNYNVVIHEGMHALVIKANLAGFKVADVMDIDSQGRSYYLNDQPDNPLSNFGQQWNLLQPYLKSLINNQMYQYFSSLEVAKWKLRPELWQLLDKIRGIAGVPIIITSGLRTPAENAAAGGVSNSAHLKGLAVDFSFKDNFQRSKILKGITSFQDQLFLEEALGHFHIDIDSSIHALGQAMINEKDN